MRKVALEHLKQGMIIKRPVLGFLGQILLNEGVVITPKHIYYLSQMGIDSVYVYDDRIGELDIRDLICINTRCECRALVAKIIKDLDAVGSSRIGMAIQEKEIRAAASKIVSEVLINSDLLFQLSDIRAQDGYLFAHSVNCSVLATMIGARMNYDKNTLQLLATGALLHDIGLVSIPQMILRKPGALSDDEYEAVKKHPAYGYEILKKSKIFTERTGEIVLQHHERNNGQGYPNGLRGKEIASLARIVSVADVFDALTSDKTYRNAYPADEAIELMLSWGAEMFDPEVLNVLVENVTIYPVGSHVLLSNNESGLVIKNSPGSMKHPVVKMLYKENLAPHPAPYNLDLMKVADLKIARLMDDSELPENS